MASGGETERRASVFEIVGAWLHIWVPPRDVEIPPVPWRKLAVGTVVGALVLAVALALLIPQIDAGKRDRAAADAAAAKVARKKNRDRVLRLQRPRHGAAASLRPAAGAGAAEVAQARRALLVRVEASILADAKARGATGEMRRVSGPTTCAPVPGRPTGQAIGAFDCFTISTPIKSTQRNVSGTIGYPFRAVVDFRHYSYTWCKVEQFPGELLIPDPDAVVQLPPACRVRNAG